MSDKGKKEDRSANLKSSSRGSPVPQLGTALVPPYPLHAHLAYSMMRPALPPMPMAPTLSSKGRPSATISNDLGPPMFLPSLNLGVPKPPSSSATPTLKSPRNSLTQSSISSTLVTDILSNAPAPSYHHPFHPSPSHAPLRSSQPPYMAHHHPQAPHVVHTTGMVVNPMAFPHHPAAPTSSTVGTGIHKPTPILASHNQSIPLRTSAPGGGSSSKVAATATKVATGGGVSKTHTSSSSVIRPTPNAPGYMVSSASFMSALPEGKMGANGRSVRACVASTSLETLDATATGGHMTYVTPTPPPHTHMIPYLPAHPHHQAMMAAAVAAQTHPLPQHHGSGSTLSKMLMSGPAQHSAHKHHGEGGGGHMYPVGHLPRTVGMAAPGSSPAPSSGGQASAGQKSGGHASGRPEGYAQGQTTYATSGQPSSTTSTVETRAERPPQPSAVAVQPPPHQPHPQQQQAISTSASGYVSGVKESADKLIISVPGLTGKHIAQITTNSTQSSSPAESPKHTGEPLRVLAAGDPASPMELEPAIPEAGVIHPSHGMAVDMGRVHGGGGQMVGVPPGAKVMSVPMVATTAGAVSPGGHPQVPGLGVVAPSGSPSLSPGGGNSSPRPRILRAKRFESNRKAENLPSPSSSPLVSKQLSFGPAKPALQTTPPGHAPSDHLLYNSTKRPLSPVSDVAHNHLDPVRADASDVSGSPRKKPRKQNVVANDDQYASNVPDNISSESSLSSSSSSSISSLVVDGGERLPNHPATMTTRSRTRNGDRETQPVEEGPKVVEVRYLAQLRHCPYPINGVYKIHHRAAHNHFRRHADIKHREDERISAYEIASDRRALQRASGWKLLHFTSQLDEMSQVEGEILEAMQRLKEAVGRHEACRTEPELLQSFTEIIEGNVDRSKRVLSHIGDSQKGLLKVLDHKPLVMDMLKKYSPNRSPSSSFSSSSSSQKSRS